MAVCEVEVGGPLLQPGGHDGEDALGEILVGVDDDQVGSVLEIIRATCKTRQELITPQPMQISHGLAVPPIEVMSGGATVFVVDVTHFERI